MSLTLYHTRLNYFRRTFNGIEGGAEGFYVSSFCNDYSFWEHQKCYSKNYTNSRLCNKIENETALSCSENEGFGKNPYFCKKSETCIHEDWKCDGLLQCLHGNDTNLEFCNETALSCSEKHWFGENPYFCEKSKTCIHEDWKCDGLVQCINGEDESFSLCQNKFPKEATFYCQEANRR